MCPVSIQSINLEMMRILYLLYFGSIYAFRDQDTNITIPAVYQEGDLSYMKAYSSVDLREIQSNTKKQSRRQYCFDDVKKCNKDHALATPVCAHHAMYGLVEFPNFCEIGFQNCLIKLDKKDINNADFFYYNHNEYLCDYYIRMTSNVQEAASLYLDGDLLFRIMKRNNATFYEVELRDKAVVTDKTVRDL